MEREAEATKTRAEAEKLSSPRLPLVTKRKTPINERKMAIISSRRGIALLLMAKIIIIIEGPKDCKMVAMAAFP